MTATQITGSVVSSLQGSVNQVNAISGAAKYSTYIGIAVSLLLVVIGGGSLEMIWGLINTLQLVAYLPLMTPFFPEHVRLMFFLMGFTN